MSLNREILRFVDTIHRDRQIDKEVIFKGIELALLSAAQKKFGTNDGVSVDIDRESGEIHAIVDDEPLAPEDLGRIAALNGKQVLYQKIREAERDVVYQEYLPRVGQLLTGTIQSKKPNGVLLVSLNKVEGFLPRSEQSPAETFNEGDRIKVVLKEVNLQPNRVQLLCSRSSPELVRKLFELEIPEVADYVVDIKAIAREPGHRTKIAVATYDSNVDCVGACVGVKGARIRNIVDELFGEKIDIVRWNESIEILIVEALRPAEIASLELDFDNRTAMVYVKPDQQSLAIGRRGQNVRLASKLTGWDLNITPVTDEDLERMRAEGLESMAQGIFQDRLAQAEEEEAAREAQTAQANPLDRLFEAAAASEAAQEEQSSTRAKSSVDKLTSAFAENRESGESSSRVDPLTRALGGAPSRDLSEVALEDVGGLDSSIIAQLKSRGIQDGAGLAALGHSGLLELDGVDDEKAIQILTALRSS